MLKCIHASDVILDLVVLGLKDCKVLLSGLGTNSKYLSPALVVVVLE